MTLPVVQAVRYSHSLREGGSMPALVEGDDGHLYVVKLRGAGQGALALVAEILSGEIARSMALPVPEIVLIDLHEAFGRQEPDPEIQDLFKASRGLNVGLRFLPEATIFDPASGDRADALLASRTVWLDAFTLNIDRTPRNANLLVCREKIWLIDHGASLYFQHNWPADEATLLEKARLPFSAIQQHILLPWATKNDEAAAWAHERLRRNVLEQIVSLVPEAWLVRADENLDPATRREAYLTFLTERLAHAAGSFEQEIRRARG